MRRVVPLVLLASVVAVGCSDEPAAEPDSTASASAPGTIAPPDADGAIVTTVPNVPVDDERDDTVPDGFERVQATVTEPDGTVCELCLWLADTADRRRKGLMFVTDLGPADGMAFVYPTPHRGNFWMKNTLLPLSIAFFGAGGAHLDAFDMEPCAEGPCGLYPTPDDFVVAIETTQGGLAELGIGPGSVLDLTAAPCADPAVRDTLD